MSCPWDSSNAGDVAQRPTGIKLGTAASTPRGAIHANAPISTHPIKQMEER